MKILVTGGAGYIGSHICKKLKKINFDPIVIDNLSTGYRENVKWGKFFKIDLQDKTKLSKTIKKINPKAIIHMVSNIEAGDSLRYIEKFYYNNVLTTLNILNAMSENNVRYIIYSSSAAVYGNPEKLPLIESSKTIPDNIYGSTKLISEKIIQDFASARNINYCNLRYFNVAGADKNLEIGENHQPETHLIPLLIQANIKKVKFNLYGDDYNTKDGTCIRDFVHVEDLADAHVKSLKKIFKSKLNCSINIGNGKGFSVKEIISETEKQLKSKTMIKVKKRRSGDLKKLVANIDFAKKKINWKPKKNLTDMISSSISYYRKLQTRG